MGPGALLRELERAGWTAWGIDASAQMVELARARLPGASDRLSVGRIEALPYPQHSFEAVTALGVLEYVETERRSRRLARVLVPGGIAVVSFRRRGLPQVWAHASCVSNTMVAARDRRGSHRFGDVRWLDATRSSASSVTPASPSRGSNPVACTVLPYPIERAVPNLEHALARRAEEQPRLRFVLGLEISRWHARPTPPRILRSRDRLARRLLSPSCGRDRGVMEEMMDAEPGLPAVIAKRA